MIRGQIVAGLMALLCTQGGLAANGNGVGNGNDPLRKLFTEARAMAADKVAKVKTCSFGPEVPANVRDWILANRAELVSDLRRSAQIWITDTQATCAWTMPEEAADITLSFVACRPLVKNHEDAMHQLIHESVHHFDLTDEDFAEAVAFALDHAVTGVVCPMDPRDPFNPDACPGEPITADEFLSFFGPGGEPVLVGNYEAVVYRRRKCLGSSVDTCTDWKYEKLLVAGGPYSSSEYFAYRPLLTIKEGMQVKLMASRSTYGGSTVNLPVQGVGSDLISVEIEDRMFPWHTGISDYGYENRPFKAQVRMTRNCLVLRSSRDLEHEAALMINFGRD